VYVDGARFADGSPGDDPLAPTALSGLSVTWGRSTTVDQPEPSTCEFTIADLPGGSSFASTLRTGLPVDIRARGLVSPDPTVSTVLDPGFDATPAGSTPRSVSTTAGSSVVAAVAGNPALRVVAADPRTAPTVLIAPDVFSTVVDAWDEIPKIGPGQSWSVAVDVMAWHGATVTVQPVLFTDPTGTHYSPLGPAATRTGSGAWQTITVPAVSSTVSGWVGVRVRTVPVGPRWLDMSPDMSWAATPGVWVEYGSFAVDNVAILAPASGVDLEVLVYSGRITDLEASFDGGIVGATVAVTCSDFTADLDNIRVGDEPWAVEPMGARFNRILALSELDVSAVIDATISPTPVSYQDVDSQPVAGLLKDLAQSVDGVMWSATHITTGPYLHVEDPDTRPPEYVLAVDPDTGLVEITDASVVAGGVQISACDVLRDPVSWIQNVADVATRVAVTWLEQGVDDAGLPTTTDRTYLTVDAALEVDYGQRGMSVSTMLSAQSDAADVANRVLARSSLTGWRIDGLVVDDVELDLTGPPAVSLVLKLLDGTTRNGLPIALVDLPAWSPVGTATACYLEGGKYAFVDGAWVLDLTVSRAETTGRSVAWVELDPAWRWVDFDPGMSWADLYGVGTST
jgi:hypothetical protein